MPPRLECVRRAVIAPAGWDAVVALCTRAYDEPFAGYLDPLGDTTHVLAWDGDVLVSHACWVARTLLCDGRALRTAYVEAVATEPAHQRRGHATRVLRALADAIARVPAPDGETYDLAALSPSDEAFYARLGWEPWRGPRAVRHADGTEEETPDEEVMILRLPRTPAALDVGARLVAPWRPGEVW